MRRDMALVNRAGPGDKQIRELTISALIRLARAEIFFHEFVTGRAPTRARAPVLGPVRRGQSAPPRRRLPPPVAPAGNRRLPFPFSRAAKVRAAGINSAWRGASRRF